MVTWLEIIDTSVKIGLGATITAFATYWHSKLQYKAESAKEYEQRHRTLLEQVAEGVEELNHVYLKYASYILDWTKYSSNGDSWPKNRDEQFSEISNALFLAFRELTSAESKLLLIGENEAYKKIRELGTAISNFRRDFKIHDTSITEEVVQKEEKKLKKYAKNCLKF